MITFKFDSISSSHLDTSNSLTYAFGKVNGTIITDVDKNGYMDLITFPSNHQYDRHINPVIWLNNGGKFSSSTTAITGNAAYQYIRDSVQGDFDKDGLVDFVLIDQGWELNNRDPSYFFGSTNHMLKGTKTGLSWQSTASWISGNPAEKSFNHIGDTADFDLDGDLDIVVATFEDVRIYRNDGTGKFSVMTDAFPSYYTTTTGPGYITSGATFIKTGMDYSVVVGAYRGWANYPDEGRVNPVVLDYKDGKFIESYQLSRPNLQGREINYGAVDMYNIDLNGDGKEDLVITWETEALNGIDDGLSHMSGGHHTTRYKDLSNTIATVWLQDSHGRLVADSSNKIYNMHAWNAGSELRFEDLNRDGHVDFWTTSYAIHPSKFGDLIWFNDGKGEFYQIENLISVDKEFESWYTVAPWFFDANNDGNIDIIATRPVFGNDWNVRNIGEETLVFLNPLAPNKTHSVSTIGKEINGTSAKDKLTGTDGTDFMRGDLGKDKIYGKLGADQFVFDTPIYVISKSGQFKSNKNQDIIYDFNPQQDQLVFDTKIFDKFVNDTDWTDNVTGNLATQDANDWLVYDNGYIYYDVNGSEPDGRFPVVQLIGSPDLTINNVTFI